MTEIYLLSFYFTCCIGKHAVDGDIFVYIFVIVEHPPTLTHTQNTMETTVSGKIVIIFYFYITVLQ